MRENKSERKHIGQAWLREELRLEVPRPSVESHVTAGARRTESYGTRVTEQYPLAYAPGESAISHLRFALRHEAFDLAVLVAALKMIPPSDLERWVRTEPSGAFSRRAWFLYETFTGRTLDIDDARTGNYVDALDPRKHFVAARRNSPRHRVINNLLGSRRLCPTVRRSPPLVERIGLQIDDTARTLVQSYAPAHLHRAVNYLYTNETRSSFAVEGERPSATRTERFIAALKDAIAFDPTDKDALVQLQGRIVDSRYAAEDWRKMQNFVGRTVGGYRQDVKFICPTPLSVRELMDGWHTLYKRAMESPVEPIIAAAFVAFSFVFIHPFEDGNGRIHRFLIHHVLAKKKFSPDGVILPVSAAILRNLQSYSEVLEGFSKSISPYIRWHWTNDMEVSVDNDTTDLYRYFDATAITEYLYDRIVETVEKDLAEELGFVAVFDEAMNAVQEIVDMPDRRASLIVRLCMQNGGVLASNKRKKFSELTDSEISEIESVIQNAQQAESTRRA